MLPSTQRGLCECEEGSREGMRSWSTQVGLKGLRKCYQWWTEGELTQREGSDVLMRTRGYPAGFPGGGRDHVAVHEA